MATWLCLSESEKASINSGPTRCTRPRVRCELSDYSDLDSSGVVHHAPPYDEQLNSFSVKDPKTKQWTFPFRLHSLPSFERSRIHQVRLTIASSYRVGCMHLTPKNKILEGRTARRIPETKISKFQDKFDANFAVLNYVAGLIPEYWYIVALSGDAFITQPPDEGFWPFYHEFFACGFSLPLPAFVVDVLKSYVLAHFQLDVQGYQLIVVYLCLSMLLKCPVSVGYFYILFLLVISPRSVGHMIMTFVPCQPSWLKFTRIPNDSYKWYHIVPSLASLTGPDALYFSLSRLHNRPVYGFCLTEANED